MIKNIWLVNKYAMPPQYESRLRTIKFAHYLQEMGYKVTIFGSSVMHNMELDLIEDNLEKLWSAYGWDVAQCDGHSVAAVKQAIRPTEKPLAVLARTTKGKGVSFMENNNAWHHATLNDVDHEKAVREIGDAYGLY